MGGTVGGSFSVQSEPDCSLRTSMDNLLRLPPAFGERRSGGGNVTYLYLFMMTISKKFDRGQRTSYLDSF